MENNLNKLLVRQIKKHFGSIDNIPDQLKGVIQDINNTYENFEDDTQLLQNSIEISSQELRDAFNKHKQDAGAQQETINKIKEAINALNPADLKNISESETTHSDSSYLFDSLIKLIEERKQAEVEILKLSKAVEQNPASIVITNIHGDIEYVNPKFCDLTGYTKDEAIGKNPRILKSDSTPSENFSQLWKTILSGNEWRGELKNKKKNGELYWESALISPIFNEHRKITHFIAIKEDITERKHAEEERIRQAGLITSLLDSIPDFIFFKDTQGVYLGCNPSFAEFVGKSKTEITGKNDFDLFDNATAKEFRSFDREMLEQNLPRHNEEWITYPDGRKLLIDTLKTPYWASDGSLIGILGISRDITKRKEAEEALYNERALFRTIIDLIPDAVYVKDIEGRKTLANPKEVQFAGKNSEAEVIGQTDFNLYPDTEAIRALNEDQLVLNTGTPVLDTEGTLIDKDGILHWLMVSKVPLRDVHGKITGLVGVTRDISSRKMVEKKLKESEANFRTFFESMDDMIFVANQQGLIFFVNSSVTRKLGYSMNELQSMHLLDVRPSNKRSEAGQIFKDIIAGKQDTCPLPLVRKDGVYVPVDTHVWLGKWDGKDAIFGLSKDLSKEQESLQKFNKIFDNNPALMAISSVPEFIFTEVNKAFLSNTGFTKDEVIGKTAQQLGLFFDPDKQIEMAAELEKNGLVHNRELKIKAKSGTILDGLFSGEIIESQGKKHFLTVMVDITESKKLEEEIKLQNDFYDIASKVSERLIQTDSSQLDSEINRSLETLGLFNHVDRTNVFDLDSEKDEISNTFEWCASGVVHHMEDLQNIPFSLIPRWKESFLNNEHIYIESVSDLPNELKLEKETFELQGIKSLLAVPMYYGPSLIGFVSFDSVAEKKQWNEQVIILLRIYASILGGVIYKKKIESALLKAKIDADLASKAKSEFLANMSHEIRTPLNGVIGFTDLLIKTPLNKIQQQYAENVNTSGHSLLGIINDILDFSKIEAGKMELDIIKTDVIELVELASDIIKYHASQKGIELLLNVPVDIPRFVMADSIRLKQILVNLLSNAVKFTESGEVELKVTFDKLNETTGKFCFSVRDTGIGINEDQQKKLFKAFTQADSSTTRKFGGTGLGLTISNMLAEKMGSKINISSESGVGSTFFFTIETEFEVGEKLDPGSLVGINRILVIDDNDNNRMILEHTFNNWGIEFVGSDNGLSALKLIEKSKPFDVIIVDYHMPYLNGIDTIKMIRQQINPSHDKNPVILLHSSSDDIGIYEECKKLGVRFNLTKPVKSQELLHYLRSIYSQPAEIVKNTEPILLGIAPELANDFSPVILVAEDVYLNMILVTTIIRQMIPNVTILEAKNGKEAFEIAINKKPALILMDVQMPEMSGIEAAIEIRNYEKEKDRQTPIVALTAGAIKGEKEKCMEAGMNDFLTKPIDQDALLKILEKHLISFYQQPDFATEKIVQKKFNIHFDEIVLMESIGFDQSLYKELMKEVPAQFSGDIASLGKAIEVKNAENIKMAAHSIKGASSGMCFYRMAEIAKEIEISGINNNLEKLDVQFKNIELEWEHIQSIIKNIEL